MYYFKKLNESYLQSLSTLHVRSTMQTKSDGNLKALL